MSKEIWFDVNDHLTCCVSEDGVGIRENYEDYIPFDEVDKVIETLTKVKQDVASGKLVFPPNKAMLTESAPEPRNCPVCGSEDVSAEAEIWLGWDWEQHKGDLTAGYLYAHGIPYWYNEHYSCQCGNCHYGKFDDGKASLKFYDRCAKLEAVIKEWNTVEPTEKETERANNHLETKRIDMEKDEMRRKKDADKRAKFDERKDDVRRMLGWIE